MQGKDIFLFKKRINYFSGNTKTNNIVPRTFVIGDIHGALKALEQLMEKINVQPADMLVFLGDYVDGWSQSAQVIDYLAALDKIHPCIFIKGNHDAWCEAWLGGDVADSEWLFHGGLQTVKSYASFSSQQKEAHLAFFNRMRNYYIDEANRLFVHAGFSSMHGPAKERHETNFLWDRTLWEMALAMDKKMLKHSKQFPKRLLLFNEIYIGHTPTLNYDETAPMHACNVWNIDTGAAFKGSLTAMDIETKAFWQSDVVQQLYPGEKGRNT
jgi:serine/threonine protein phosphatase 1